MTLLKTIMALLLIVVGALLIAGPLVVSPGVALGLILLAVVLLAFAWSLWFVVTIERHFADNKRMAAKGIDPGYDGADSHSHNNREK